MKLTRRMFLKNGGIAMLGMSGLPSFLERAAAGTPSPNRKTLVVLFQRGAMDGLNVVVPFGERAYHERRPTIAIPEPKNAVQDAALDLDGFFGLHPSLAPLATLFRRGELALVHAVGSPHPTRSHFDAQDFMETGTPGVKRTDNGWLNRALQASPDPRATPLRAVAVGPSLPRSLQGQAAAVALPALGQFRILGPPQITEGSLQAMYAQTVDPTLHAVGQETLEAVDTVRNLDPDHYQPAAGAEYPRSRFGRGLMEIAQLLKAEVGIEVAFLDSGGWDTHVNEGGAQGQLANLLRDLAQGLAAFHKDMGDRMRDIVVVTMSEFGRTVHENGNGGTDHGHANCMFLLGGPVKGGKVYARWPGLALEQLYENRDLAVTTDFRLVLGEILTGHLGSRDLAGVFPGFKADRS